MRLLGFQPVPAYIRNFNFYDYETNQSIAVVKSSGIGWTISQDQELAYKAIKKELNKFFLKMDHKKYWESYKQKTKI